MQRSLFRSVVALAITVAIASVAGCTPTPGSSSSGSGSGPATVPPSCPFDRVLLLDGDSLGVGYAPYLELQSDLELQSRNVFSAAVGGSSFTQLGVRETIDDRVRRWTTTCGRPDLVVIEGGINDLTNGVAPEDLIADVAALSADLEALGIEALWVTIAPLAEPGGYSWLNPRRREYNDWLRAPGNVHGTVVDLTPVMEDPARPDTLRPAYWWYWNDLFKPDGIHPNQAGYRAMAGAIGAAVEQELAG